MAKPLKVYCSGPLFNAEEMALMQRMAEALEAAGFQTYLPQRDGLENYLVPMAGSPLNMDLPGLRGLLDRAIFALDVYQLSQCCDVLVINLNGRVPDEGACVEAGMAYALGKPVLLYKNDIRASFDGHDNSMLSGLSKYRPQSDLKRLVKLVRQQSMEPDSPVTLPATIRAAASRGQRIHRLLSGLPRRSLDRTNLGQLLCELQAHDTEAADSVPTRTQH